MIQIEEVNFSGRGGPTRMLSVNFRIRIRDANTLIAWTKCEIKFKDMHLVAPFPLYEGPRFFQQEEDNWPSALVPLSAETIRFIEENRNGDLALGVQLKFSAKRIDLSKQPGPNYILELVSSSGGYNTTDRNITIPRSNWIKELVGLGWSEIELFEVDKRPFRSDKYLAATTKHLTQAQNAFREGNYVDTLDACDQALALLSNIQIPGTPHKGLDALVYRCFRDPEKQRNFKTLLETTQGLCRLGLDKEKYPPTPFSRAETTTQLRLTLALFELLSHQLTESAGPSISG